SREHQASIRKHGQQTYPEECCGLILGVVGEDGSRSVSELVPLKNQNQDSRNNRFLIEPMEIRNAEKRARESGLDLLGFYHSHPDAPARPSQFDLDHAWPWYSYIIVSIQRGTAEALTCWQ